MHSTDVGNGSDRARPPHANHIAPILIQIASLANQLSERDRVDPDPIIVAARHELSQSYGFARLMRVVRDSRQVEG